MGTASTTKLLKIPASGIPTEETTLITSAGVTDANKIPALNSNGVLDATIINGVNVSVGAGDAGRPGLLDASGKFSLTMMPTGIGADTGSILASEALAAGDLVNLWNNSSIGNVRKADASTSGKEANGFVLAAVTSGTNATVYFEGTNTQVTGLTPGPQFLSATVPGKCSSVVPSAAGQIVQNVGFSASATTVNFQSGAIYIRA